MAETVISDAQDPTVYALSEGFWLIVDLKILNQPSLFNAGLPLISSNEAIALWYHQNLRVFVDFPIFFQR